MEDKLGERDLAAAGHDKVGRLPSGFVELDPDDLTPEERARMLMQGPPEEVFGIQMVDDFVSGVRDGGTLPSPQEIAAACEAHRDLNFDEEFAKYPKFFQRPKVQEWMTEANGLYYRMLAAYTRVYKPRRVCEIGTCHGASALALAKFGSPVDTYDIDLTVLADPNALAQAGVKTIQLHRPDDCLRIEFDLYDFLFIDIGNHDGRYEKLIYEKLVATKWRGVAAWDDVHWAGLQQVWDSFQVPKIVTDWHGASGFGVTVHK